ncbi:unnamed protein product [Thlaspi arvense]|uniref:Uncharacterized protein n=1 Tax=Thlaspi arvense TaxID=13288 RepID=A0AAU9T484_THLAR|nr:unnamed protein product [Thlaspi arvense]
MILIRLFDTTIARHYVHIKDLHELSPLNNTGSFFVLRFRHLDFRFHSLILQLQDIMSISKTCMSLVLLIILVASLFFGFDALPSANSPHFSKRVCGSQCTSNYGPQKCYQDCVNPPKGFLRYTFGDCIYSGFATPTCCCFI